MCSGFDRFNDAVKAWDDEVYAVAARLVEQGIPPLEAVERAVEIVRSRRAGIRPRRFGEMTRPYTLASPWERRRC